MAMAESELGVSILPKLILERCPYRIAIKSLDVPAYRDIAIAFKEGAHISAAVKKFLERRIRFLDIYDIISDCMREHKIIENPSVEEILDTEAAVYERIESRW